MVKVFTQGSYRELIAHYVDSYLGIKGSGCMYSNCSGIRII